MNVLWITSWNREIYEASGKELLRSFINNNIHGDIFTGEETDDPRDLNDYEKYGTFLRLNRQIIYNLANDIFLQEWLKEHKYIIPDYLGGNTVPCKCKNPFGRRDKDHKTGCYFSWWNRNCSRWFRKIACLRKILKEPFLVNDYDYFIWIDSDCIFRKPIPDNIIIDLFANTDIWYMRGKKRRAVETGLFGIQNNDAGRDFIKCLVGIYENDAFKKYDRWDDGFIFKQVLNIHKGVSRQLDIAATIYSKEVADYTVLSPYIKHNKGTHGRVKGIMK